MNWKRILPIIITICLTQIATGQKAGKNSEKAITITGKVFNQQQNPIAGAVFYIDNVKTSYISKSNGTFKIKVSPSANKLMVRSSEYGSDETIIGEQTNINFTLKGIEPDLATQPFEAVTEPDLPDSDNKPARRKGNKMNTYNDIYQMIRGEVSGVVVSGKNIQIQQGHSFFGSSEPLYVVNGVIVNSIDLISPLEVRSIKVIKGSAAAIYGIRGANGVISITLLNGSEEEK